MTAKKSPAKSILIIEDEPHVADMLYDFFNRAKYSTERCAGAKLVNGEIHLLEGNGRYSKFDVSHYAVAVIDARIRGCTLEPEELGKLLFEQGLAVAYMAGLKDLLTPAMTKLLRDAGITNNTFLDKLIHGMIDLSKLN